ncbi:putative transferase [Arabidopsis thaliana]
MFNPRDFVCFLIFNWCARYPDDVYDRQWKPSFIGAFFGPEDQREINTNLTVNSSNPFELPQAVARFAATPINASDPLRIYEHADSPSDKLIIYLHFAELQDLQTNDTREFDIVLNKNIIFSAYSPKKLQIETIFNRSPTKCDGVDGDSDCGMELVRTGK